MQLVCLARCHSRDGACARPRSRAVCCGVACSLYAKYYYELRTLRDGDSFPLQPLKPHELRRLQARSAAFDSAVISARDKEMALERYSKTSV